MINLLIRWSLANRLIVVMASAVVLLAGSYVVTTMPVDVFPDLTAPTVTVLVEGHGMAPEEMETLVTFPIETAVNGATDVRRVRSATAVGIAVVWVEFEWGTDIYKARQTVNERLSTVAGGLPPQVEPPVLAPVSSIMGEILFISLTSDRHDALELRTTARTVLRRRLLSVAGVSQVTPIGGDQKQYQVLLSPQRLRAYQVSVSEVIEALRTANENVSAGFLVEGAHEALIQGVGRFDSVQDIADTVVTLREKRPIKVGDLGVVGVGAAIKRGTGFSSRRGPNWQPIHEPGVIIAIQKQPGANTLEMTGRLDRVLDEIQASLPAGMFINKSLFRQANFIKASIENVVEALWEGGALVVVIVLAFLVSLPASFITLLAMPLSLVAAILSLKACGATINTMTLGGMAIAIGSLVDDAIINVENMVRRLRENAVRPESRRHDPLTVIFRAGVEVQASVVFATLIILLVFLPIFFLSGIEGRLLFPVGLAFCVALTASLLVALTLTPALASYLLPRAEAIRSGTEPPVVRLCKLLYARPLGAAMRHPWFVLLPTAALFIAALLGVGAAGRNFLPEFNEGALVVGLVTLPGTSLQQSDAMAQLVQKSLMDHPEIVAIGRRTGRAEEDEHVQGIEASEIDLTLDMDAPTRLGLPRRSKSELLAALRQDLAAIPGVQTVFGQPISHRIDHMLSGTRASIAVKIFGEDLRTLRDLARQVENVMRVVPGVVDLSTEQQTDIPTLRVEFDRQAIARFGLSIADVAQALEAGFRGQPVTLVLEGKNAFELVVRVGQAANLSAAGTNGTDGFKSLVAGNEVAPGEKSELVGSLLVDTPGGAKVPLRRLARISEEHGPNLITRENVQRKIVVMSNVAGRDVHSVVNDIRQAIEKGGNGQPPVKLPDGYFVEFGGQFESEAQTARFLGLLGIVVVVGIGFLLHVVFRSMRDALLIMVNLPLALIGGVLGVYLSGGSLSVASLIGFITVFGIAARNGIMMVSHIRHLQRFEGVRDFGEAVHRGAMERLAPILMTALAAGLALIPLTLGVEKAGNEILRPMAMVILFGLLSSTFLNMVVVPALFLRFAKPVEAMPGADTPGNLWQTLEAPPATPS